MRLVSLRVLQLLLAGGGFSVSRLAGLSGFSASSVSRGVKELAEKGLVEKRGRGILIAATPVASELKAVSSRFSLEKILLESREKVLLGLLQLKTARELSDGTGLSEVQVSRLLKGLMETGAAFERDGKIFLDELAGRFAGELKKAIELKNAEPHALVVFSGSRVLKKAPLGSETKGTLTAFSRFAGHGVEYLAVNDFFVEPEHEVSIEEIFVHALAFSETKKDVAMCLVFFEKNREKMLFSRLVELAREFEVLQLLLDCIAFLEKRDVREKELFLPWGEYRAIAGNYGLKGKASEKFSKEALEALFSEIGAVLKKPLPVFLIGGCNMALQGIKAATKDIDLVVKSETDFALLSGTLKKLGFLQIVPKETAYKKMNANGIFEKPGKPRVDAFTKIVCNALSLSNEMVDHSLERKFGLLSVNFLKPEDIILFKAITEREADLEDIAAIIRKQPVDWHFFLNELDRQHLKSQRLFCLDVLDMMGLLEEKEKIRLPIKQKLASLCLEKAILFLARKSPSIREIADKIKYSEPAIRNKVAELVGAKKLKALKGRPFRVVAAGKQN